ncbi:unnamed protein product [Paramecium octaurelia]|uniref:Uncharacterized protein n=1 Tax=Paramecium octaurelia TaxID=43137 RepID=A0A8S1TT12_PAROT|nr:unnamed protein product [Paramecium octaurelia]
MLIHKYINNFEVLLPQALFIIYKRNDFSQINNKRIQNSNCQRKQNRPQQLLVLNNKTTFQKFSILNSQLNINLFSEINFTQGYYLIKYLRLSLNLQLKFRFLMSYLFYIQNQVKINPLNIQYYYFPVFDFILCQYEQLDLSQTQQKIPIRELQKKVLSFETRNQKEFYPKQIGRDQDNKYFQGPQKVNFF